nr:hypothetical protein [Tanacetum cinerariifolium]
MSNTNNNMQTQTSNTLHNAIMEAGSKDRPPMLAPEIRDQLNAEAEAVQIILTGIDNDIYSTIDACLNAYEMWKEIERGKAIVNSPQPIYDQEPSMVAEDDETSKDKEIDKLIALISLSSAGYENQRIGNVAGARENVGSSVKPKRAKDAAYQREKMLLCKQEEAGIQLNAEQADWRDDTDDDELEDQELEAHYMYMAQLQEVSPDAADSGPISDDELVQKVSNDDHYNVFAMESIHPEQSKSMHDTYPIKQDAQHVLNNSLDMNYDREQIDQNDDDNDLAKERELLASLIEKLKCEIDESKNRNKFLETSNKVLIEKLKGEIEDFKNKNKSLESSNNKPSTNNLMYADYKKLEAELARRNKRSRLSHTNVNNGKSKESFHKQTTLLEKQIDESIQLDKQCQSSLEIFKVKSYVNTIITGVELCKQKIANKTYIGYIDPFIQSTIESNFCPDLKAQLQDKGIVISELKKLTEKQKGKSVETKFEKSSVIRQPNAFKSQRTSVIGKPTTLSNSFVKKDFSKSTSVTQTNVSNDFSKPVTAQTLPSNKKSILKNTNVLAQGIVIPTTSVSIPQLKSNPQGDRVLRNSSQGKKQEVEDQRRSVKLSKNKMSVTACNDSLNAKTLNVNYVCATCDKCVLHDKHDMYVLNSVAKPIKKTVASKSNKKPRNFTRKLYEHASKTCSWWYSKFTPSGYKWKPKSGKENVNPNLVEIVLFIIDSGCSKHMTGNLKLLINFVEKFLGTVKFGNDQITPILGYGDPVQGAVTIKRGNDLLTCSRGTDLYSITLQDTNSPNLIFLMAKATSSQAWLWHHRLSHLNFDTINLLSKNDIVVGLPKLKFVKDHLCSSYEIWKAKRKYFHTKLTPSSKRRLQLLHMDLCSPMRVASINGKRYVLVIVDDYSRYTWTHFLRSKDETPVVLIDFLRLVQRGLQAQVRLVRTDKGTEFLNQTLHAYFATEGILHQTSVARTPEQNGVMSKSSAVSTADAPNQRQHHTTPLNNHTTPAPICQVLTLAPTVISSENINQAETYAENDQVADDEFINIFSTPV